MPLALTASHGGAQQGLEGTGMPAAVQDRAQHHRHQPHHHSDQGCPGLPQPQALTRHQKRDDDEDEPEQDRLTQVSGHGTATHGGGQPTQPRQPAALPGG